MKRKDYIQPTMEVVEIDINDQILAGSVSGVSTTGLGDDDLELDDNGSGDLGDAF